MERKQKNLPLTERSCSEKNIRLDDDTIIFQLNTEDSITDDTWKKIKTNLNII